MWSKLSLRFKLTVLVVTLVTAGSVSFLRFSSRGLIDLLNRAIGQGVVTAALSLEGIVDEEWFYHLQGDYTTDPDYNALRNRLKGVVDGGFVKRIDMVRFSNRQEVEHVLNLPANSSPDYFPPGTREQLQPTSLYWKTEVGYSGVELADAGTYIAGWSPILYRGERVGMLMVIGDATDVQNVINTITIAFLAVIVALILLSGVTTYRFASSFEKTAVTDGLMGIYNHKFFKQRLEQEVAKSARYGQQTALVLMDIDFFKRVNDTYGHATGDIVLKNLAKIVVETSRNTDVVARYGGEEVAVILTHTGLAGAQEFAERLRLKVAQHVVRDPEEAAEFRVTVSIGVAQWEKGIDMLSLIKRADAALYHSKHMGRNRVTIYQDDILPAPETPKH